MRTLTLRLTDREKRIAHERATAAGFTQITAYLRYVVLTEPDTQRLESLRRLAIAIKPHLPEAKETLALIHRELEALRLAVSHDAS